MNFIEGGTTIERNGQIGGQSMNEYFPYNDIIDLPHHQSDGRKHMSLYDRAAQFSPFAALTGYDEIIAEEGRITDDMTDLPDHIRDELDRKLILLSAMIEDGYTPEVTVTYFVPDKLKAGGSYETYTGEIKKIDYTFRTLVFYDREHDTAEKVLNIDMIVSVESRLFDDTI